MRLLFIFLYAGLFFDCSHHSKKEMLANATVKTQVQQPSFPKNSWQYFLQHLPLLNAPIVDYNGNQIKDQWKHVAIVNYDVGTSDLQQCADALMRLRAEYLFTQKRYNEIGFHFCSGEYYSWNVYRKGLRPFEKGSHVQFIQTSNSTDSTHQSMRNYLNIVYAYANTISLCQELKSTDKFEIGTVIIKPGSPGHTCIIIDDSIEANGNKLFKIAEGYMPAQSIYVLSNPFEANISPWYNLSMGEIITASYDFKNYLLKKFE